MDGCIIDVTVKEGDRVEIGQTLVVLDAMKMEHSLKADSNGTIESISIKVGDQVKGRQLLVNIKVDNI
jgi:geranyl-CoA carboxylase alpha subunit